MEIVTLGVNHLLQERHLVPDLGTIVWVGLGEIVGEILPIVKIAQQVLSLLELAYRSTSICLTNRVCDLHRVPHLLDRNASGMHASRKIHAGGVIDRLARGERPFAQRVIQVAAPAMTSTHAPRQRARKCQAVLVERSIMRTASRRSSRFTSFRSNCRRSCSRCWRRTTSAGAACGMRVSSDASRARMTSASRTRPRERPRRLKRECRSSMGFRRFPSPSRGSSSRTRRVAIRAS